MGMYTEYAFDFHLKADTPASVIFIIKKMVERSEFINFELLWAHPFFKGPRCNSIFRGASAYFHTQSSVSFEQQSDGRWRLQTVFNYKDYDRDADLFYEWLAPYIDAEVGTVLGYSHYEEDEHPVPFYRDMRHGVRLWKMCDGCNEVTNALDEHGLCIQCGYDTGYWPKPEPKKETNAL